MKKTNVEWIGDIPESWNLVSYKYIAQLINGYAFNSDDYAEEGIPIIRISDVRENIDWSQVKKIPNDKVEGMDSFFINNGDILIALTGGTIGKTSIFNGHSKALLNQRVGLLKPLKTTSEFLKYIADSTLFKEPIKLYSIGGAQPNIGKQEIDNLKIPFPTVNEQQQIANFLDEKTFKLDSVIASKQKQINLLKEQKQALISEVVTKGLNSHVNNSSHAKLRYFIELDKGKKPDNLNTDKIGRPYISASSFDFGIYKEYTIDEKILECNENDSIVLWDGARAGLITTNHSGAVSSTAVRIRANNKIHPGYLFYILKSNESIFRSKVNGTTIPHMSKSYIDEIVFKVFPMNEQEEIVEYLNKRTIKIGWLISKIETEIEKLKEYKQSLIFEAVTGKIDVTHEDTVA
ncbi:hypothetical protein CVD28_00700 [Bacillus sp. M6-12]|uniref:restriction endonuclease subunit S n=1 Tax=Bacillus sp. M6-12 TaxID=2054166 RepID=UPI000C76229F|nr:restriction endonuclease subunit S [Bacillus sp. M6-12]PLS18952.1 hypothetical protein CVD28_00700 [Bacillus sp. M6-12]